VGDRRGAYRALVVRLEGKTALCRLLNRWQNNIKMDLQDMEWGSMDLV
jgi:hypothetical protein